MPDGSTNEYAAGIIVEQVIQDAYGRKHGCIAAKINGVEKDIMTVLDENCSIDGILSNSDEGMHILRHSCSHLLAQAVTELFPDARPTIGPAIENGFYYDFAMDPISEDDLRNIEKKMNEHVRKNHKVERIEHTQEELIDLFANNEYKVEIINDKLEAGTGSTIYRQGDFYDLCMGPHVSTTAKLAHFRLTSMSSAYWRADQNNDRLVRIYGMVYPTKELLKQRIRMLEEAKKRDHRILGKDLQLFHIDEEVGQGLILWAPRGATIRSELQNFISSELKKQGYQQVFTPHVGKLDLYRTSGHFPYYQESQYPPLIDHNHLNKLASEGCSCSDLSNQMKEGEIEGYLLKPMNCPHHIKIFASQARSYRDLPLKLAEFGTVYRWEQSGEISGMTRVRGFTQDDAHLFCTEEQLSIELQGCLKLVKIIFNTLGMSDYRVRVGLRDPDSSKYVGSPDNWDKAENACRLAAETLGVPFTEEPGEAAFYGPKIDFVVKDVVGREWQLGTVQVDYNLPERFDLNYAGADGNMHRPVMIHRAPFGSMERFVGVLIEHFAGKFPTWLSPYQVNVATISEKHVEYANKFIMELENYGIRVHSDLSDATIGKKIRSLHKLKTPYLAIIGDSEVEKGTISLRGRNNVQRNDIPLEEFIKSLTNEIGSRNSQCTLTPE